ncbi:bacterio-opsin activator-like protein [Halosimplex carlsbadense 2-9-1]|uniref:Bacterio-opsin activator-like protein n=1 Tax=Halosimplex carlsbadense 2-9-1 TaxID=797114 RepID=M0CK88_9EURY|nr:helix-turn-helix domain-containing protein [Halosimplex carlsbadense]ELZ22304.1 bacterio-opsin activator-like protein [Halosimplex carlsbadense 2-9-1]
MGVESARGIQVRLAVEAADACPVAAATGGDTIARSARWSTVGEGEVVEEFDLVGDAEAADLPDEASVVFETDRSDRVRFTRETGDCICEAVERLGAPVTDVSASRGTLRLSFHATDVETVRAAVDDLDAAFGSVRIDRLARTGDGEDDDLVLVDRGRLTDRQQEVLETAMEMGYFERPRSANATEVAERLDISPSTFAEHLASAQSKVLDSLLEGAA